MNMDTTRRFLGEPFQEAGYYEAGAAASAVISSANTSSESSFDDYYYSGYDDGEVGDDIYYNGYVPTSIDPDWWYTVKIIAICLLIYFSLPLWICVGRCLGFHDRSCEETHGTRSNRETNWEDRDNHNDNDNGNRNNTSEDILMKQMDEARSMISGCYSHVPDGGGERTYPLPPGSALSGSIARSRAGTHLGFHHRPHNSKDYPSSPGSVLSGTSAFTTSVFSTTSAFTNSVLCAKPKRTRHAGRRPGRTKRIVVARSAVMGGADDDNDDGNHYSNKATSTPNTTTGRLDVRMAAEFKKAEIDLLRQRQNQRNEIVNNGAQAPEIDLGGAGAVDDSQSEVAPSILSKLDPDAISVHDAVDAQDGGSSPLGNDKLAHYCQGSGDDDTIKNGYGCSIPMFERLFEIADFDKEMKKFVLLATHYSIQGIIEEILGLVEIALIGHLMGVKQANAYIVVEILEGFTGSLSSGFYECAGLLIPQANGAKNYLMIGRYMQLGTLFYTVSAIPGAIFWCFYMDKGIIWYGFDEETAAMGQKYLLVTLPCFFTYGFDAILWEVLNTVGHEKYATWFTVTSGIFHSGIVVGMLFWGVKDLYILGLFEMLSEVFFFILNFAIMTYMGWLDKYWEGLFKTNGLKDFRAVKNVLYTSLPLTFSWILTYGEWEVYTFFARSMGDDGAEVAAWVLMGYVWGAFEMFTDGFGDAAEVRVGFRMGAGQIRHAKLGTEKAMYFCFTMAVYATGTLFLFAMYLPGWLTPDPTLQRMIFDIIPLVGVANIWMVTGMVAYAIIGAQGRIQISTFLEFFISWGIGAPLAAIMTLVFNYNLEGIVGSLTITYTIGTNVYLYMLWTSDWEALSANVIARNAVEGQTYDGFDWTELPEHIEKAAKTLGYDEGMWNSGEEPESNEKSWEELTSAQKKAAIILGYSKKMWNCESESDTDSSVEERLPFDDYSFDSLPLEAKKAAVCLGYNKSIWNSDGEALADGKTWENLTSEEQKAAEYLGYDSRQKWAILHKQECTIIDDEWASLSTEARNAAKILGYTAKIWNSDGSVSVEDKDWDQLTAKERSAAKMLGYTEEKWNVQNDSDESSADY